MVDLPITRNSTLIILDWDDTLFPTSWTIIKNIDLTNPQMRKRYIDHFHELDNHLSKLLIAMQQCGDLVIITNAMLEWVWLSSSILPMTGQLLENIQVISARGEYQAKYQMPDWKKIAFRDTVLRLTHEKKYNNIISIGDAEYEHQALVAMYLLDTIPHKYLKSIKFVKTPDHSILLEQIKYIEKNIRYICRIPRHLDLEFR